MYLHQSRIIVLLFSPSVLRSGIGSCGGDGDGTVESAVEDARASASNQNVCFRLFDAHCHFHLDEGSREALPGLGLSGVALMATEPPDWEAVTELQASVQTVRTIISVPDLGQRSFELDILVSSWVYVYVYEREREREKSFPPLFLTR